MANSIRTPKQGTNATSRRIAQAVDDEEWQEFRVSMKGVATEGKLVMLQDYYEAMFCDHRHEEPVSLDLNCDICIRVDNYLKALARGGQLESGVSLEKALEADWKLTIRK
jgi:hypothetical protein